MRRNRRVQSNAVLFIICGVFLPACGLGAVSTSAQNNSTTASSSGTLSTSSGTVTDPSVSTTPQGSTTDGSTTSTTTATPAAADPSSPNETVPAATPTTPSDANQTTQNANQAAVPKNFYETSTLTTSAFSWNEQSGVFTLILSTDPTVCALRTANSVKTNSRELQITATVLQKGNALTVRDMTATMVLFGPTCAPAIKSSIASGASSLELNNLSSSSVTGTFSFSLTTGADGAHAVAGIFSAPSCSGLSNGVPTARVCLR